MNRPDNQDYPPTYISTREAAAALRVSVTTVKRWVDQGILPAHRTPGGHRKLLLADVLRLVREGRVPNADVGPLLGTQEDSRNLNCPNELRQQILQAFKEQDYTHIQTVIRGAYYSGLPMDQLADEVITPVMHAVGHAWEEGRMDVMHEHRLTQEIAAVLYELREWLRPHTKGVRPRAIGGAPEGDHYLLPSLLAQLTLLDCGWDAINLGPHTPVSAFRTAVAELRPRLVWLSVTYLPQPEPFLSEFNHLSRELQQQGVIIAVGGQALTEELRCRMVYTSYGDRFLQLAALARSVSPPPAPPRRGRPPAQPSE